MGNGEQLIRVITVWRDQILLFLVMKEEKKI